MPTLYPFQEQGAAHLSRQRRACLFDSPGLGKTPQALTAAKALGANRLLVVCPTFAIETWRNEIATWWPELAENVAVVSGLWRQRDNGWRAWRSRVGRAFPRVLLTTYRHLEEVSRLCEPVDVAIFDEAHALTNRQSKAFKAAKRIKIEALFLLTGTPTRQHPSELWNYLHLIDRKRYSSFWRWASEHFNVIDGRYGKEISAPRDLMGFRRALQSYILRRQKDEVLTDLPPLTRQPVLVEGDAAFRRAYDLMANELIIEMGSELVPIPNRLALTTRLRQLCVCPEVLGMELHSPTMEAARRIAESITSAGEKLVVFTPFRQAIPHLIEMFDSVPDALPIGSVHGEQNRETNAAMIATFQRVDGPAILIATISMAASWSANTASSCLFLGFSFSPIDHVQSEGRLHRHGQQNAVNAYYVGVKNSIDEHVIDVLAEKVRWEQLALDPQKLLKPSKYDGRLGVNNQGPNR